jgi:hypothetical protein
MAASSEEAFLGDNYVVSERYAVLVMKPHALADPRTITDLEFPGKLDSRSRPENDAIADGRAE